ncbi:lysylphosphatidylglycerol synthase domain-containing protein [Leptolyngbya ohadii]|uniref:lysylphosphatidylglycerol synthase domain-containing protein n=1 Tax=Leptolyngbya ohadii TaxID=1962290 RepID=UPI000B59C19A|nr:lysylphosphatidylglycerol synthase domain-containing protein [Leptolyngbya ohadii]
MTEPTNGKFRKSGKSKQSIVSRFKPYLRWVILGATLFFLSSTLKQHWDGIAALKLRENALLDLSLGFGVTLLAHCWTGYVWNLILKELNQKRSGLWAMQTYLKTNIAKYLPGNVWHFYGRVTAAQSAGIPLAASTLSVLLEPLLMAASALCLALLTGLKTHLLLQAVSLVLVLAIVHPRILNRLLEMARQLKGKPRPNSYQSDTHQSDSYQNSDVAFQSPISGGTSDPSTPPATKTALHRYPLIPLAGEFLFVLLRGAGFLLTFQALQPLQAGDILPTLSGFSIAWLLGLVIPGAPGGIGVFEATAVALLSNHFPAAVVLGGVALYRLISTLAEAAGAALAALIPPDWTVQKL